MVICKGSGAENMGMRQQRSGRHGSGGKALIAMLAWPALLRVDASVHGTRLLAPPPLRQTQHTLGSPASWHS